MNQELILPERIIKTWLERVRPREDMRDKVDVGYSFKNNVLLLFEIRPQWDDPSTMKEYPFARAKFIKTQSIWEIYWLRASGKWELYAPFPITASVAIFLKTVEEDKLHCFRG